MCIAIPAKVLTVDRLEQVAGVEIAGQVRYLKIMLNDELKPGDWILSYGQAAIAKLDEKAAKETLNLLNILETERKNHEQDLHSR